jgi:Pectate lyase superfamily protein
VLCGGGPPGRGSTFVYPDWFGAVGDGSHDDTSAIQAAINAIRQTSGSRTAGTVMLTKGSYAISSLDMTLINGLTLTGQPGQVVGLYAAYQSVSSKPVLDMTGCVACNLTGLSIQATSGGNPPATYPSVGILLAEQGTGGNSNFNVITDVSTDGWYTIAGAVCYSCTETTFIQFQNNFKGTFGSSTTGLILTNTNDYGLSSPYVTINPNPDICANLNFYYYGGGGVKIDGCQQVAFNGGNIAGSGSNAVQFENHASKEVAFNNMQFATGLGISTAGLIYLNLTGFTDGLSIIDPAFNNSVPSGGAVVGVLSNGGLREPRFMGWNASDLPGNAIAVNIANISSPTSVTLQDGIIEAANRAVNAGGSISGTTIVNASAITVQGGSTISYGALAAGGITTSGTLLPTTDNTQNIGAPAKRVQNEWIGTSLTLGSSTNPAVSGLIRVANANGNAVQFRNAANNNDVVLVGLVDGSNNMSFGDGSTGAMYVMRSSTNQYLMSNARFLAGTPTIGACGTGSITAGSTDLSGEATATGATSCVVNFSNATGFSAKPWCVVNDQTRAAALQATFSQSGFTVNGLTSNDVFNWICIGR